MMKRTMQNSCYVSQRQHSLSYSIADGPTNACRPDLPSRFAPAVTVRPSSCEPRIGRTTCRERCYYMKL